MKKMIALALLAALALTMCACQGGGQDAGEAASLRFAESVDYEALAALNGKRVTINGYMATLSPIKGDYIYLMNLPYQSCPFCVPNTTQLANTMAVYAKGGSTFAYTDQAIRVTGTMEMGDFTDDYGYQYNYRIADAVYEVVDLSQVSKEYALWTSIAADGIVADVSSMFDFLYFVCQWTEYTGSYTDENGLAVPYYLYPGDAENALADEGIYGYAKYMAADYFDGLIARVRAISATELEDLATIISDSQAAAQYALGELSSGNYTYDQEADKYTLNSAEELTKRFDDVYARFSAWLNKWEL